MARPKLTLFVDVVSPFAYIAYHITRNSPTFKQCDITYVPILLGGVMKKCNNRPPLEIKNKDKWIEVERKRWAKMFRVPISEKPPSPFPQSTVNTGRTLCAISLAHPDKLADCLDALYHAFWVEGQTIGKPDVIGPAIAKVLGEAEAKKMLEKIGGADVKKLLTDNSDLAFAEGAFGLPWFVAENAKGEKDRFWGVDHMGLVVDFLGIQRKEQEFKAML